MSLQIRKRPLRSEILSTAGRYQYRRFFAGADGLPLHTAVLEALRPPALAVQAAAREAYRVWQGDPYDTRLEFKQVLEHPPVYSVRIGYRYRALGRRTGDTVVWFWIGTHEEYNNRI